MPFTIKFAWRIGAIDVPTDHRRMHKKSIPRNGGMAIGLGFMLGCACLNATEDRFAACTLIGGLFLLLIGLADDVRSLSAYSKLAVQVLAAVGVVAFGTDLMGWKSVFAVVWIVMLTNSHNFIDGLDGLFCGVSVLEAVALGVLLWCSGSGLYAQITWCLAVACLGFRVFNRHPARIFAGDCGSGSVGFWLGALSLSVLWNSATVFSLSPLLVFAYPLVDLFTAVSRRLIRGKSPFAADRGHLHHRICDAGLSCNACVSVLLLLSAGLCGIAVLVGGYRLYGFASLSCILMAALLIMLRVSVTKKTSP